MSSAAQTALRVALAATAVAVCLLVLGARRSEERCSQAGADVVRDVTGTGEAGSLEPALATLRRGCTDSRPLVLAASELARAGRQPEATPLAQQAVREEPENPGAWLALFAAQRGSDAPGAARARDRVLKLNPLAGER